MAEEIRSLTAAAARMRRTRERRRRKFLPIGILLHEVEIAELVRRRLLAPEKARDKAAVREAVHRWLDAGALR